MSASPPGEGLQPSQDEDIIVPAPGISNADAAEDVNDNEVPPKRLPFPPRSVAAPVSEIGTDGTLQPAGNDDDVDRDDDGDDDNDKAGDEQYVPATATTSAKIPKFKKNKKGSDDEDNDDDDEEEEEDDDDEEERRRRRKKKKRLEGARKRRERAGAGEGGDDVDVDEDEEAAPVYDEATQRRMALEERIDNIGKKAKVTRRKKKGDDDVDIVDSYHDDVCARLRDRMIAAADRDEAANRAKLPGTAKLAMLDEVMGVLRNTTLWQSIVDNGVLEAVKRWLEPLPDRSLPSVGIQKSIFEVLPKMDLDTTTLKECRLGPIVLFYTKTKRVTPAINRQADALVQAWSRPIIKRPANFRSRHIETQDEAESRPRSGAGSGAGAGMDEVGDSQDYSQSQGGSQAPRRNKRFDVRTALAENAGRKGARLQIVKDIQYTVAPESRTQHLAEEIQHVSRIQMDNKKFNKFARQMKGGRGGR
ncbi:transcription factor IWS1 [Kwoniella heveanensis BCC8398]|uniref:Transcription factor IWS1 n=1 Tax=Kwoniella heveanensis BCC8398 TaxID=1296120 RepID=A0A1B9GP90_9TREE|nr:transcription factor IWS1 [Kwoniella heveanensis BCC8398]